MKPQSTIHQALKNGNLDKLCINHFVKTYQPTHCVQVSWNMWGRCCGIHDANDQGTDCQFIPVLQRVSCSLWWHSQLLNCGVTASKAASFLSQPKSRCHVLPHLVARNGAQCAGGRDQHSAWGRFKADFVIEINRWADVVWYLKFLRVAIIICTFLRQYLHHFYPRAHLPCFPVTLSTGSIGPSLPLSFQPFRGLGGLRIQAGTGGEVAYLMRSLGPSCHGLHGVQCVLHTFGESWFVSHNTGPCYPVFCIL